jgi:signal transduction histidine kinase
MKQPKTKGKGFKSNIFATYFVLFSAIFLAVLTAMGTTLIILVSNYSLHEKTQLLEENATTVAQTASGIFTVDDMNNIPTREKAIMCESINALSNAIDADIFICDVGGNVIMCKEKAGQSDGYYVNYECKTHSRYKIRDSMLQRVYEGGAINKTVVNNKDCYVVGTTIENNGEIIGTVFAVAESGTTELMRAVIKIFAVSALICILVAFVCIWIVTRRMVTPLRQMSAAVKRFAVGDFSYRLKVEGTDEFAELSTAFNEMADALDKLESSRSSFVANVSHELKTPMTSIAGFIDGILDGTIPKSKQDYYLKIVSDEIRRLSRLVVAMLNMSKIESGDFEMKPKKYNLTDQIIHILLTFEQKIEKKNIEIKGLDNISTVSITADPDMIYQVIYNLFDNAVKFTNENGYIQVDMVELNDSVQVSIKNSGSGIDSAELPKIFERFYKVDKSRSLDAKGAGLGLYIVKKMVEMHGGRIYAKSDNSSVAEFIFTLPKEQPKKE